MSDPMIKAAPLVDKFGRTINYIRLSITDKCDFRCTYCMAEEMTFLPRNEILSLEECYRLVSTFVALGVTKVRITGGEPLVRKDALHLFQRLGSIEGLKELVTTTNGSRLEKFAQPLKDAGVKRINISLDTIQPDKFKTLTRVGDLDKVLRGIDAAIAAGFKRIKLNTVMMKGFNDQDLPELVRFAMIKGVDISFIEEMPLGAVNIDRQATFFSSDDALALLRRHFEMSPTSETSGGPAKYWKLAGSDTRVGFISPHSHNFCGDCNRVRITCKGELYPCLGQNDVTNLMEVMRAHPDSDEPLKALIIKAMDLKPLGHDFNNQMSQPQVVRFMSMTGG